MSEMDNLIEQAKAAHWPTGRALEIMNNKLKRLEKTSGGMGVGNNKKSA